MITPEQAVEFRAIALGQLCCLTHISPGHAHDLDQIIHFKTALGISQGHHLAFLVAQGVADERGADTWRGRQNHCLLDHIGQLPDVARPGRSHQ